MTSGTNVQVNYDFIPGRCSICLPRPQLAIISAGANVILTWPTNVSGFALETATNLVSPIVWKTNLTAPVIISGENVVTNPITDTQQFYRLKQ
jgi:hypothetical protein